MKSLVVFLLAASAAFAAAPDVLIVYDPGQPYRTLNKLAGDPATVASATPKVVDCRTIAEQLAASIESRKLTVRLVAVSEIKDSRDLLEPKLVIFGTPVRFWNVSWQMKRLFDVQFYEIYTSAKQEFARRKFAAFAIGQVEPCARAALDRIRAAVEDCSGKLDNTLVIVAGADRSDAERDLRDFADTLLAAPQ